MCIWSWTCLPLPQTITFLETQNHGLIMQRADPALCGLLFVNLSLALVTHDIRQSNLIQTCSCAHTVTSAWGILWTSCAYKIGALTIPYICSSFFCAFVAGSISNHRSLSVSSQDHRPAANNSHTTLRDWRGSGITSMLANKPVFTLVQNTDWSGYIKRLKTHSFIFSYRIKRILYLKHRL